MFVWDQRVPTLLNTTTAEVKNLPKKVNSKKAAGFDKSPPKLVELAGGVLAAPLLNTINNSMSKGVQSYLTKDCPHVSSW